MSIKAPLRTLTVASGRDVIGTIQQKGDRQFLAVLASGKSVGIYGTTADAAQAINKAQPIGGGA